MAEIVIKRGRKFKEEFKRFPESDQLKIAKFISHVKKHGFQGLEGRNKKSDDVDKNDGEFLKKIQKVRQHNLWHYHIGIICYNMLLPFGDRTSEYVLHYVRPLYSYLGIVDFSSHPPFKLPRDDYLVLED